MKEAIVLDLGDLGAQAAKIRMRAEAQAEQILEDARAQGEATAKQLTQAAEERGHAEGLARGIAEGQAQGKAQALDDAKQSLDQLTAAWSAVAAQWETQRIAMERDARQAVMSFALRMAEKIVHRVVALDSDTASRQVEEALALVLSPHDITVRIHPEDRAAVERALPQIVSQLAGLGHIELADDDAVGQGGCTLTLGGGQIDATIATQIERIAELVLPQTHRDASNTTDDNDIADAPPPPDAQEPEQ